MALENVNILKLSATALAGLFTGGAVFVNIVEIPALRNVTDTEAARKNWKESFLLASRWQVYTCIYIYIYSVHLLEHVN
jgi:hypothetical protein